MRTISPVLFFLTLLALPLNAANAIRVDQLAYPPGGRKVAVVVHGSAPVRFAVYRLSDGAKVFEGDLSAPATDANSGDVVRMADFSPVTAPGRYELRIAGLGSSDAFQIGIEPYRGLLRLAMRSFYGQRCGTAVDLGPEWKGYAHPACHLDEAYHPSSGREGKRPPGGGWHDAGDYGRYVVNSGITTATLLWAWELFPASFAKLDLSIPESRNRIPDVLDEARWNLEWMLSMQDSDGGVWHKLTSEKFPSFVMPEQDQSAGQVVIGTGAEPFKSSCATANLAAVMAVAGRVYRPFDRRFATRSLNGAKRAWEWLEKHPNVAFHNPPGVSTGEYGDDDCRDERLWAAAELWRSTGHRGAHAYFVENVKSVATVAPANPPNWREVGALAAWTYALSKRPGGDAATVSGIRRLSLESADAIVARAETSGYLIPLTEADYVWGSNGVAANYGLQLLIANAMRPDPRYVGAAAEVLHYLLGRNPFSLSWVTGVGANAFRNPHHRPSGSDRNDAPWPGLLSGGPNRNRQDDLLRGLPADTPPGKMYVDAEASYASNENAINWNAPLVFLVGGLVADGAR